MSEITPPMETEMELARRITHLEEALRRLLDVLPFSYRGHRAYLEARRALLGPGEEG